MTSVLQDTGLRYATAADVEAYIRNKSFDATSDPTKATVEQLLDEVSEQIDRQTGRAWRERKVADRTFGVAFDNTTSDAFARRRRRSSRHGLVRQAALWGKVFLPHMNVSAVDSITVIQPDATADITAEGPDRTDDDLWYLDGRKGVLEIDAGEFLYGPIRGTGIVPDPRVEVTYRYGQTSADADSDSVPDEVPRDIRRACGMLVAADLTDTDAYGSVVASGPENTPDQTSAAANLREEANSVIDRYRQGPVL